MKSLFTVIILLIAICATTAQVDNFKVDNGQLVWQKVYDTTACPNNASHISGEQVNYLEQGYRRVDLPLYFTNPFYAVVNVETKPDKYRITVRGFRFKDLDDFNANTNEGFTNLEDYVLKKDGTLRESQIKAVTVLDRYLQQRFRPVDGDW